MKVLMISANTERINVPVLPLGAGLVAAAARAAGHEAVFLDLKTVDDPIGATREAIGEVVPDVIGLSVRNIDDQCMASPDFLLDRVRPIVAACRDLCSAPVVLGGAGYSIFPSAALEYLGADFGVRGEGELVFVRMLSAIEEGTPPSYVPGVHVPGLGPNPRRPVPFDLGHGEYPLELLGPSIDLEDPAVWVPIQTRRGCPLDCSYCSTSAIEGRSPRMRPLAQVMRDIMRLSETGVQRFHFVDNTFNLPHDYALDLCRRISALDTKLEWRCILYPYKVTQELVAAMGEAGCAEVALGFDSGCNRMLTSMNKRFTVDHVQQVSRLCTEAGIRRLGFLLLGGPGETRESVEQSLDLAESLDLDKLRVTIGVRIYPDTAVAGIALEKGVIAADDDLLRPRFYLEPELDGWIQQVVEKRSRTLPVVG